MTNKLSKEDIVKILEAYMEAKEAAGQKVIMATLYETDTPEGELIVDNREKKDIN